MSMLGMVGQVVHEIEITLQRYPYRLSLTSVSAVDVSGARAGNFYRARANFRT
jgi:hypothetical protein